MNGKLVPILITALLTINVLIGGYLASTVFALNESVIRIEENMWTKDDQTKFIKENKLYGISR